MAKFKKEITLEGVIREVSFGAFSSPDEIKPLVWGLILPVLGVIMSGSLWAALVIPGFAIVIMVAIGEEKRAIATLKMALLLPVVAAALIAFWAILVIV